MMQNPMDQLLRMMVGGNRTFQVQLRCYSAPFMGNADESKVETVNYGGKIILPNSALDALTRMHVDYPMLFKITNTSPSNQRVTHVGVLEFSAEEGRCYAARWIMNQLHLQEGDIVNVESVTLPKGSFVMFKPQSTEFLEISNPKAMLEVELRKFGCLTKGDVIALQYNRQVLEFAIRDTRPANAIAINDCDLDIDFDKIDGYQEPKVSAHSSAANKDKMAPTMSAGQHVVVHLGDDGKVSGSSATSKTISRVGAGSTRSGTSAVIWGKGMRVDGKPTKAQKAGSDAGGSASPNSGKESSNGNKANKPVGSNQLVVNLDYTPGQLTFPRGYKNPQAAAAASTSSSST